MRPRGAHFSQHLLASSISELELFCLWPGLSTEGDRALLMREGLLVELNGRYILTPKGADQTAAKKSKAKAA